MSAGNGVSVARSVGTPNAVKATNGARATALAVVLVVLSTTALWGQDSLRFGAFGTVHLYRPSNEPSSVVLFLSGDGGWNRGVVDMARSLAGLDALVVGIDLPRYLARASRSAECLDPPADLEALGQYVQKRAGSRSFRHPVLVGYSSGATLTYTTLVQAPPGTFAGGISLGFCPDQALSRPLCRTNGLSWRMAAGKHDDYVFEPVAAMPAPWFVLQGTIDQVCDVADVQSFVRQVTGAEAVVLPRVGHGFSVQRNWMPQFRAAFSRLTAAAAPPSAGRPDAWNGGLPLVELPAPGTPGGPLAVMVTGDGGWAGLDRAVGKALAEAGVAVVGLSSIKYFWHARTPEEAANDLDRILKHYAAAWNRDGYVLIGYSFGADVLPFMVNGLPPDTRAGIRLVTLLAPSRSADFEIHIGSFLDRTGRDARPTAPEWLKMTGLDVLCVYGVKGADSPCSAPPPGWTPVPLPGGHHFDGDYRRIAQRILAALRDGPEDARRPGRGP